MRTIITFSLAMLSLMFLTNSANAKGYGAKLCNEEGYHCYTVKKGDTWSSLFPEEEYRNVVKRINRMNVGIHRGMVIAVPENLTSDFMEYAPFPSQGEVTGNRYIIVSKSKLAFGAYGEDGELLYWGPVSTGKSYCADIRRGCGTPTGTYAIYNKGGAGCKSRKFPVGRGGAPMPYCMFYYGGFALHGSHTVPGYNDSHGCIRLVVEDAKYLSQDFTAGISKVIVKVEQ
jgi:lipoprotein-anchoring transpeptidase ErfK/SrfK